MTTNEIRWALLKPDEDGSPLRWLSDADLPKLLADPTSWGVDEFKHLNDMDSLDPNYWRGDAGVLLRIEVVVPVRGGWRLPGDPDPGKTPTETDGRWRRGNDPVTLKDVSD